MPALAWNRRWAGGFLVTLATAHPALAAPAAPPRAPEAVYAKTCGYCHGQHVAPIIRGRGLPPEIIIQYVRTGPRAMPAFRPTEISDAELKALAKWVSTSKADPKEHDQ
ncbi:MAG: hypothetical protein RIS85_204 [Pseudomonadota bacterium]|jgi:mono/diheme cytochrome c family protein